MTGYRIFAGSRSSQVRVDALADILRVAGRDDNSQSSVYPGSLVQDRTDTARFPELQRMTRVTRRAVDTQLTPAHGRFTGQASTYMPHRMRAEPGSEVRGRSVQQ